MIFCLPIKVLDLQRRLCYTVFNIGEAMKESQASLTCPVCKAEYPLDGVDIGGLDLMPLPVHVTGRYPSGDPRDSMLMAESLSAPDTCKSSEQLVRVVRVNPA